MTPLSELTDKDLAVLLAERLGDLYAPNKIQLVTESGDERLFDLSKTGHDSDYLYDKASQILFSEGMAGKICEYLRDTNNVKNRPTTKAISDWFCSADDNFTLNPRKIIEVYLSMEDE